jgi:hypothetical protein
MSRASRHSLVLGLFLVGACATEETELSRRVKGMQLRQAAESADLEKSRIELRLADGATTWCPSAVKPAQLRAIVHTADAEMVTPVRLQTATPGYLPQAAFEVKVTGAALGPEWILEAPSQPAALLALMGKTVAIDGHLKKHPSITSSLELRTNFDCDQGGEFPGRSGREGNTGGMRGEPGEDGLDLAVSVGYLRPSGGAKLVLVKVAPAMGATAYFVLAPDRRLGLNIRGGDGGRGGFATVRVGLVEQVRFHGGVGGDGGNGGRAVVRVDARSPELRAVVTVVNPGGKGGPGGNHDDYDGSHAPAGRDGRPGPAARLENEHPARLFQEEIEAGLPILSAAPDTQI